MQRSHLLFILPMLEDKRSNQNFTGKDQLKVVKYFVSSGREIIKRIILEE